jgi:hypothetical protein
MALYNNSGTLTWNGIALGTGSSVSGTTNYIPIFTGSNSLGNSAIYQSSGNVGIGTTSPIVALDLSQQTSALALPVGTTANRPTGGSLTNGEIRYNTSTPGVEAYVNGAWSTLGAGGGGSFISSAGHLVCSGADCSNTTGSTTIAYCPYKGNVKTTASQGDYTIPSGCLTATTTSMYVNGSSGTSLSANTTYYIYLWNNSGTWVLDASTTGHATDSSTGIEIKSGDNTRTLVGMIRVNGSQKVFTQGEESGQNGNINTVATWDNRAPTVTRCWFEANRTSTSNVTYVEVNSENRCHFMSWGDAATFVSTQNGSNNTVGAAVVTVVSLDGVSAGLPDVVSTYGMLQPVANYSTLLVTPGMVIPSEGYHYTVLSVEVSGSSTVTFTGQQASLVYSVQ